MSRRQELNREIYELEQEILKDLLELLSSQPPGDVGICVGGEENGLLRVSIHSKAPVGLEHSTNFVYMWYSERGVSLSDTRQGTDIPQEGERGLTLSFLLTRDRLLHFASTFPKFMAGKIRLACAIWMVESSQSRLGAVEDCLQKLTQLKEVPIQEVICQIRTSRCSETGW